MTPTTSFTTILCLAVAGLLASSSGPSAAAPPVPVKKTYTYKTAGDVKINLDVYRPDDDKVRPIVVWIHGGALISGSRNFVPKELVNLCAAEGYALASLDYRLAPEVKIPEIIGDVEDAFTWLRAQAPKECRIDPDRLVVTGGSAGGYLTLMTGFRLKNRPKGLVSYYGYGDVDGDWYTKPSEHYRKQPLVSKEEALEVINEKAVTGSEPNLKQPRGRFYLYCRQNGLWTKEVTGYDPATERAKLDPFCPVRNVTPDYPPTMLLHGTADTDVPYELSENMAKEFTKHKVPHEFITLKGAGHGFGGFDKKLVDAAYAKVDAFIRERLK